jgi:uncharacterized protein (DUF58 family)
MNVLWIMLVAGALMGLESTYMRIFGMRKIQYERYFTKRELYCGDEVEMVEVIANQKLTPVPWLRIESRMSAWLRFGQQENLDIREDLYHRSIFFLRSFRRIRRRHRVTCMRRGYYNMNSVTMSAGDILGLWNQTRHIGLDAALIVYPRLMNPDELPIPSRRWQGDCGGPTMDPARSLSHKRHPEYRSGDALRDVHWGATAGPESFRSRPGILPPRPGSCCSLTCS